MRQVTIAVAGALGALARYALGLLLAGWLPPTFPWATLLVNLTGSALLGFALGYGVEGGRLPERWRLPVTVGFLGSYTTFSTWSVETVLLLDAGRPAAASLNVAVSLAGGLAAVWLGYRVAHRVEEGDKARPS